MAYKPKYQYKSVSYHTNEDRVNIELAKGWEIEAFTGNAKDYSSKYVFYLLKKEIDGNTKKRKNSISI